MANSEKRTNEQGGPSNPRIASTFLGSSNTVSQHVSS